MAQPSGMGPNIIASGATPTATGMNIIIGTIAIGGTRTIRDGSRGTILIGSDGMTEVP